MLCRISCDTDGWVVKSNKEKDYPTFLHIIQPAEIVDIQVRRAKLNPILSWCHPDISLVVFFISSQSLFMLISRYLSCYLDIKSGNLFWGTAKLISISSFRFLVTLKLAILALEMTVRKISFHLIIDIYQTKFYKVCYSYILWITIYVVSYFERVILFENW